MHTHTFFCKCICILSFAKCICILYFANAYAYFLLQMHMHIFFCKCVCIFSFANAYAYFLLQMHVHIFLSSISPLSHFLRDKGFILAESVDKDQSCSLILLCTFRCCFIKFSTKSCPMVLIEICSCYCHELEYDKTRATDPRLVKSLYMWA